jgi:hypothetical protein
MANENTFHIHHTRGPYAEVASAINSFHARSSTDSGPKSESSLNDVSCPFVSTQSIDPHEQRAFIKKASKDSEHAWEDLLEVTPDPWVRATLGPRFWALLIGNDHYPQSPLEGAVNDSLAWESYLVDFFGVPENHIIRIENADRKTMVTALYDLRDNTEIKEGDHVLFAYSGHGSGYDGAIHSFEEDVSQRAGPIEALCPVDRGLSAPDISDREVLLMLTEIHNRTKANITVFLDCSHSTGGTRSVDYNRRSRSLGPLIDPDLVQQMFVEADNNERRGSTISVCSPTWATDTAGLYRPVMLTACQDTELALEEKKNGVFTSSVLKVLRSGKRRGLTCSGLVEAINTLSRHQRARYDGGDALLFEIDSAH